MSDEQEGRRQVIGGLAHQGERSPSIGVNSFDAPSSTRKRTALLCASQPVRAYSLRIDGLRIGGILLR
jgi:hypothetical protein